ncbi:MAG TPA: nitrate reductase associated protein [Caldimonas sp.]|jgi:hypothetical protein|nr:nitrate reductase associated protein [Caldimonas sp.]
METWIAPDVFDFESAEERTLDCMPMRVRLKLDLCGFKLSLAQWAALPMSVRRILLQIRCDTLVDIVWVGEYLRRVVEVHGLLELPVVQVDRAAWNDESPIPSSLVSTMTALQLGTINEPAWRRLNDLQRFALIKLSRPGHTRNLAAALHEFGLAQGAAATPRFACSLAAMR